MFGTRSPDESTLSQDILVAELLRERKRDRRAGIIKAALFMLAALVYFGWWAFFINVNTNLDGPDTSKPFAAVVKINGPIGPEEDASFENVAPLLRKAFEHPNAKGVVLSINSPGGTPVQASLIHDLIVELKAKHKKPVIAVGEDMMTSGAYFIGVAADKIVVNRSTVIGSVGVISAGFGFTGIMDKLGVERRVATAGNSKSLMDPFSPQNEAGKAKQAELLGRIHTHFIDTVKAGRGERLKLEAPGLFEGSVWTGDDALTIGVADELGNLPGSVKKHLGVEHAITLARQKPMLQNLLRGAGLHLKTALIESAAPTPMAIVN